MPLFPVAQLRVFCDPSLEHPALRAPDCIGALLATELGVRLISMQPGTLHVGRDAAWNPGLASGWAEHGGRFTGALREPYVNVVVAPPDLPAARADGVPVFERYATANRPNIAFTCLPSAGLAPEEIQRLLAPLRRYDAVWVADEAEATVLATLMQQEVMPFNPLGEGDRRYLRIMLETDLDPTFVPRFNPTVH